jgi:hypothetical protein
MPLSVLAYDNNNRYLFDVVAHFPLSVVLFWRARLPGVTESDFSGTGHGSMERQKESYIYRRLRTVDESDGCGAAATGY